VESFQKDRNIIHIPLPIHFRKQQDGYLKWIEQLEGVYFFGNQRVIFDCHLMMLNKDCFLNYNTQNDLSFNFTKFVLSTLPNNIRDKKKRFYKPPE
jgi:hypothetical protein